MRFPLNYDSRSRKSCVHRKQPHFKWCFGCLCYAMRNSLRLLWLPACTSLRLFARSIELVFLHRKQSHFHDVREQWIEPSSKKKTRNWSEKNLKHFNLFLNENKWWIFDTFFHLLVYSLFSLHHCLWMVMIIADASQMKQFKHSAIAKWGLFGCH